MLLLLSLAAPALSACPDGPGLESLAADLDRAQQAFTDLDVQGFNDALDRSAVTLACVDGPLGLDLAARYHALHGLRQYVSLRDREAAVLSFASARRTDPRRPFPPGLVPEGHAVMDAWSLVEVDSLQTTLSPDPRDGQLYFDGEPGLGRPASWPTIVQVVGPEGSARTTAYLAPGDPLPWYDALPLPEGSEPVEMAGRYRWTGLQLGLAGGAILAAASSGVLYAFAVDAEQDFMAWDDDLTMDELESKRARTNRLVYASGGAAGAALLLGAGVYVAGRL